MKNQSRIYTFLDQSKKFSINFFDAQKFVKDACAIQKLPQQSLNFFVDSLLSYPTLLSFTKPGEEFGLYLDNAEPYFLYKFESFHLNARTLLLPDNLSFYPEKLKGVCRLQKYSPSVPQPYTSLLEINHESPSQVFDKILRQSYQVDASLLISKHKNQSVMVYKIPEVGGIGMNNHSEINLNQADLKHESAQFIQEHQDIFNQIFSQNLNELLPIVRELEKNNFDYLVSRVVNFSCRCSKQNFIDRLTVFGATELKSIFAQSKTLTVNCDYCKTAYEIDQGAFPSLKEH